MQDGVMLWKMGHVEDGIIMKGERIHLQGLQKIAGFAAEHAKPHSQVRILVKGSLTSDDVNFYKYMDEISSIFLGKAGLPTHAVYQFIIVLHHDLSVDIWINDFPIEVEIRPKKDISAGEIVDMSDVADIRRVKFNFLELSETDDVMVCLKVGWKFGFYFDFRRAGNLNEKLDSDQLSLALADLYRRLIFEAVYNSVGSPERFKEMLDDGWFPFTDMKGREFKELAEAYEHKFDLENKIDLTIKAFDSARIESIISKWWKKAVFQGKKDILQPAIKQYLSGEKGRFVLCLNTLVPQIEGILRECCLQDTGRDAKDIHNLTRYMVDKAEGDSGSKNTLLLPRYFSKYLKQVFFSSFDLKTGDIDFSRHTIGHGLAAHDQYTRARALQAILVLGQIYYYL